MPKSSWLVAIALSFTLAPLSAGAQADVSGEPPAIKVIKVKGNRAVVIFSKKRLPLRQGMVGNVVDAASSRAEMTEMEPPSKKNFIGLEGGFSMLKSKVDGVAGESKADRLDLSLIYGWNTGRFEFGPLVNFSFEKQTSFDTKTIELGGQFDYNINKNDFQNSFVYSARVVAAVGQQDNSAQSKAADTLRLEPGFVVKWFGLDSNLATLASLSYRLQEVKLDSAKTETNGLVARLGIQTYF